MANFPAERCHCTNNISIVELNRFRGSVLSASTTWNRLRASAEIGLKGEGSGMHKQHNECKSSKYGFRCNSNENSFCRKGGMYSFGRCLTLLMWQKIISTRHTTGCLKLLLDDKSVFFWYKSKMWKDILSVFVSIWTVCIYLKARYSMIFRLSGRLQSVKLSVPELSACPLDGPVLLSLHATTQYNSWSCPTFRLLTITDCCSCRRRDVSEKRYGWSHAWNVVVRAAPCSAA